MDELPNIENKNIARTSVGYTYPMVFAEFSLRTDALSAEEKEVKLKEFFLHSGHFDQEFNDDYGFNLKSKLDALFNSISGGRPVKVPKGMNQLGTYPFGNFRHLKPNGGGVSIHCGNFFQTRFRTFYGH